MITLKAATCGSTFAHAHRGRGTCCSSTQNPPVRPAGGRFVRLGLHLIALRLCCSNQARNGALARPDPRAHHRADQLADCSAQNSESASQSDWKSAF